MSLCIYLTIYHLIFLCEKIVNVKTDTFSHDAIKQTNALIWCRLADINASLIQKKYSSNTTVRLLRIAKFVIEIWVHLWRRRSKPRPRPRRPCPWPWPRGPCPWPWPWPWGPWPWPWPWPWGSWSLALASALRAVALVLVLALQFCPWLHHWTYTTFTSSLVFTREGSLVKSLYKSLTVQKLVDSILKLLSHLQQYLDLNYSIYPQFYEQKKTF